ncbi:MAG: potassium transporter [Gammaproteobacteria bacterium]|nr:MAG: potassium transporter [Gammaproteobacteria bacterium]
MRWRTIARIVGMLIAVFSTTLIPPLLVALWYEDGEGIAFAAAFIVSAMAGVIVWWTFRHDSLELKIRDGFLVVFLFWFVLGLVGALPFYWADALDMSFAEATFETFSGLTTTGATVITGLDDLPHALLYYRSQLQWLGGMGIIVLAVAVMPMLGIGGMQLFKAETPGPVKDAKLTPRIAGTASALWRIYFGLTALCALAYWLAGMSGFDAINHAFTTISTGGMSTHDASLGYFDSKAIHWIANLFMLLGATNFSLHFATVVAFSRGEFPQRIPYFRDSEFLTFFTFHLSVALICAFVLWQNGYYQNFWHDFHQAVFHAISVGTSTGFSIDVFQKWPSFLPMLLMFGAFVGGCAGSTGGGMKVIRIMLLFKQGWREIRRLIHPNGVFVIRLANRAVPEKVIQGVWGFFATFVALFVALMLLLMADGLDPLSAFSAVVATINNMGPGLERVASDFRSVSDFGLWVANLSMLLGRLEIFTILVLLSPDFWRR